MNDVASRPSLWSIAAAVPIALIPVFFFNIHGTRWTETLANCLVFPGLLLVDTVWIWKQGGDRIGYFMLTIAVLINWFLYACIVLCVLKVVLRVRRASVLDGQ